MKGLRAVIAEGAARPGPLANWAATPRLVLLWIWLGRVARRFEAVLARPARIRPASTVARGVRGTRPSRPDLPRGWRWLHAVLPGHALQGCASQLRYLLSDAEMVALLTADPRAARLLRPLCRRLGIGLTPELPTILFLPPRRRRPAPAPPPDAAAAPASGPGRSRLPRPARRHVLGLPDLGEPWPLPRPSVNDPVRAQPAATGPMAPARLRADRASSG